jgi:DNA-directed RNA polymerase subunit RPC12/RpoP
MAAWALRCPNCNSKFAQAPDEDTMENYYLPRKPTFPADGKLIDCPNCGHRHKYQQIDLIYEAAASA